MTDYRLDRLSPRLFEHVIQSLAVGAITTTATPFGDGPDGGREATFDGVTSYGPETAPWVGYGIIQAKYHVREQDPKRDAAWACAALKKELRQYLRKRNPRPVPDYFIFATNVVLSPGAGGGKDKLAGIMQDFVRQKGLKDFDIWDYDKLRVLLDRDKEVRRAYMAWILPSDVIAELCESLGARKRDYYKIVIRYLQRELLADQFAQLEQAGHSADESIPLAQVFIDLPTSGRPSGLDAPPYLDHDDSPRFVHRVIQESATSLRILDNETSVTVSLDASSRSRSRPGRYVLIGGPGQGKTTVAQYICQIFRSALLRDVQAELLAPGVETVLDDLMSRWQADKGMAPAARRLPFRIVLSQFAKSLASGESESLMGYLAIKMCAKSDIKISAEEVEKILSEYPTIIILDGLDEVPASTNRDDVLSAVSNFSVDVASGQLDVFLIATTRPQGYNEEFSPRQYSHYFLTPLSTVDALKYGDRLAASRFGTNEERFSKVTARLRRAITKPSTARLMRTPLQVTILTLLVDRMGDPPEERWGLFRDYYQLIYERETERDIPSVAVLKEHRVDVDVIHRRVGIALQVESERSGGTDARLSVDQFGQLVEDYLKEEKHSGNSLEVLKRQIIDAAAYRLVFLVGLESGQVGFEIRSLQEFMAAEGIVDAADVTIRQRLRAIASSSHWRNVFLFAAGKCFTDRRHMRDTIQALCAELNDDPSENSLRVLRVGSELALDLLEDGPARKTPFTRETLTRLAVQLLDTPFKDVSRVAAICEQETRYIFRDFLRERLLAKTADDASSSWQCLVVLIDHFGEEFEEIAREMFRARQMTEDELSLAVSVATGANDWITRALFERFRECGPVLEIESQENEEESEAQYGPWVSPKYPSWIAWYAQFSDMEWSVEPGSTIRVQINGRTVRYSGLRRVQEHADGLIIPEGIPEGSRWDVVRKVGEFCGSPNASRLASTVDLLWHSSAPEIWNSIRLWQLPWPLAETLLAKRANPTLPIEELVLKGQYGDQREWIEFERELVDGVRIEDLVNQPALLDTSDGGYYLFPYRSLRLFSDVIAGSTEDPLSTLALFDAATSPLVRLFLSDILLAVVPRASQPHRPDWLDRVVFAVCEGNGYIRSAFFRFMADMHLGDQKWSRFFESLPVSALNVSIPDKLSGLTVDRLGRTFSDNSELTGLLVPLATSLMRMDSSVRQAIVRVMLIDPNDTPIVRGAKVLINIMAGSSVNDLRDEIESIIADNEIFLRSLVTALLVREPSYRDECRELMDLMHLNAMDLGTVWQYLYRNFSRRHSGLLGGEESWERLELPVTMRRVLKL